MIHQIKFLIFLISILFVCSCNHKSSELKNNCDLIDISSLSNLKGALYVNTKNDIIFHESDMINKNRYGKKIRLIPCDNEIKEYIFKEYDIFLYLKQHQDHFIVSINGVYLTSDSVRKPQEFLTKSINITY